MTATNNFGFNFQTRCTCSIESLVAENSGWTMLQSVGNIFVLVDAIFNVISWMFFCSCVNSNSIAVYYPSCYRAATSLHQAVISGCVRTACSQLFDKSGTSCMLASCNKCCIVSIKWDCHILIERWFQKHPILLLNQILVRNKCLYLKQKNEIVIF